MRVAFVMILLAFGGCESAPRLSDRSEPDATRERAAPRNVILVTVDTLRADVLGSYGGDASTPVLDAIASTGWRFSRCYSASMLTNPSHASLMTSLYSRDHGVYDNSSGIQDGARTLAGALQQRGVQTGAVIGFPHLNPNVSNLGQGFERIVIAERTERRAGETTREGLSMIDGLDAQRPFFLWLHYTDPHAPYEPDAGYEPRPRAHASRVPMERARRASPGFQRMHPWFRRAMAEIDDVESMRARYVAEVEATDAGIGQLVAGLRQRGLWDETALVVTADHGENFGEHELYFHHGGLYQATVHVPLIAHVPGAVPATFDATIETVDIAPTILDLVGAPRWEPMRGHSLMALVDHGRWPRFVAFSEHMDRQQVAVRTREGLLILHRRSTRQFPSYPFVAGHRERYDLAADPRENTPLAADDSRSTELERALGRFLDAGLQLAARPAQDQDQASLRALGYVE